MYFIQDAKYVYMIIFSLRSMAQIYVSRGVTINT